LTVFQTHRRSNEAEVVQSQQLWHVVGHEVAPRRCGCPTVLASTAYPRRTPGPCPATTLARSRKVVQSLVRSRTLRLANAASIATRMTTAAPTRVVRSPNTELSGPTTISPTGIATNEPSMS